MGCHCSTIEDSHHNEIRVETDKETKNSQDAGVFHPSPIKDELKDPLRTDDRNHVVTITAQTSHTTAAHEELNENVIEHPSAAATWSSQSSTELPAAQSDSNTKASTLTKPEHVDAAECERRANLLAAVSEATQRQEWCEAEAIVMEVLDALESDEQKKLWASIEAEPVVKEILYHSQILWDARNTLATSQVSSDKGDKAASLGYAGWTMLPPVNVDMTPFFPDAPKDFFVKFPSTTLMMWRQDGDTLCIKVLGEAPAKHPTLLKSFTEALVALFCEADLNQFIPIFTAQPSFLSSPRLDFSTWREQHRIRFVLSEVAVIQMNRMFTSDGAIVLATEKIWDDNDDRRKKVHVPSGYVLSPGRDKIFTVLSCGEEHFNYVTSVHIPLPPGTKLPKWILNIILSWLFPTVCRKIFHVIGSIFENDAYTARLARDETGLYARVLKAEDDAKKRESTTGKRIHFNRPGEHLHQDSFAMGLLAQRLATLNSP